MPLKAYLFVTAVNYVVGLGYEANLQQKAGLKPGRVAMHLGTGNSGVLLVEERQKTDETNYYGGKL